MHCLSPEQLAFLATSIAVDLAKNKDIEEIGLIRTVLSQISATLATIINQKCNQDKNKKDK